MAHWMAIADHCIKNLCDGNNEEYATTSKAMYPPLGLQHWVDQQTEALVITSTLTWKEHTATTLHKASGILGVLRRWSDGISGWRVWLSSARWLGTARFKSNKISKKDFSGWQPAIVFLYLFLFHSLLRLTSFLSQSKNQSLEPFAGSGIPPQKLHFARKIMYVAYVLYLEYASVAWSNTTRHEADLLRDFIAEQLASS